jgi:hypothetical protein
MVEATANVEVVDLDDPCVVGTGDNRRTVRRIVFDLKVKEGKGRLYLRIRPVD